LSQRSKDRSHDQPHRIGIVLIIYLFLLFMGFVILGMMISGAFSIVQGMMLAPFVIYGIISSARWLIQRRDDVFLFQEIIQKKITRRFTKAKQKIKEKVER
jgi:hypothetical protein